jgi:hypothetical protein
MQGPRREEVFIKEVHRFEPGVDQGQGLLPHNGVEYAQYLNELKDVVQKMDLI